LHKDGDDTSVKLPPKIDGNSHQRLLNFDTCSFTKLKNNNNFLKKLETFKLFIKKKNWVSSGWIGGGESPPRHIGSCLTTPKDPSLQLFHTDLKLELLPTFS
jgi:hypothetical protein